jgi:hypothetical protein
VGPAPRFFTRRLRALAEKAWNRLQFARGADNRSSMTLDGHKSIGIALSPRKFFELCLAENDRRMSRYDARLLRPNFMPALIRLALPFLGRA